VAGYTPGTGACEGVGNGENVEEFDAELEEETGTDAEDEGTAEVSTEDEGTAELGTEIESEDVAEAVLLGDELDAVGVKLGTTTVGPLEVALALESVTAWTKGRRTINPSFKPLETIVV